MYAVLRKKCIFMALFAHTQNITPPPPQQQHKQQQQTLSASSSVAEIAQSSTFKLLFPLYLMAALRWQRAQ